jgi:acetoin utilization deacetylase AcuC-like enzyme
MSSKLAVLFHPAYLEHVAGHMHPERPERLTAIMEAAKKSGIWKHIETPEPRPAPTSAVARCHSAHHIDRVQSACVLGRPLDADTGTCTETWDAALLAAGAGITAADLVMKGSINRAFCAVRPPGHHAESNRAMGFCLLNNAAITARHLQDRHGLTRVAIVDFDAHHGNGTQEIFYSDGSVLYASTHQWPLFPGTGSHEEIGHDGGEGATVNCPMEAGSAMPDFQAAFEDTILPALDRFKPEFLVISAGFDSHRDDPLTDLGLQSADFGVLTGMLTDIADRHCAGRVVSFLEGGYDLHALAASTLAHLTALSA